MRELQYKPPFKVKSTRIESGERLFDKENKRYYSKWSTVETKLGVVTVLEFKWETNKGVDRFSVFSTVLIGWKFTAYLDEVGLSDRNLKWLSTHFIKNCIKSLPAPPKQ